MAMLTLQVAMAQTWDFQKHSAWSCAARSAGRAAQVRMAIMPPFLTSSWTCVCSRPCANPRTSPVLLVTTVHMWEWHQHCSSMHCWHRTSSHGRQLTILQRGMRRWYLSLWHWSLLQQRRCVCTAATKNLWRCRSEALPWCAASSALQSACDMQCCCTACSDCMSTPWNLSDCDQALVMMHDDLAAPLAKFSILLQCLQAHVCCMSGTFNPRVLLYRCLPVS